MTCLASAMPGGVQALLCFFIWCGLTTTSIALLALCGSVGLTVWDCVTHLHDSKYAWQQVRDFFWHFLAGAALFGLALGVSGSGGIEKAD